jgi:hypothetical protein
MEKLQDIEEAVSKAVSKVKEELGKIDVDVSDYGFTMAKIDGGVSVSMLIKVNITKK